MSRVDRVRSSMLWAAWADALGFISELTTAENLRRRTRGRALDHPMSWQRNIGGRVGVRVTLPEGCYSDDTQLRLATARAISNYGFDVEAFARVELPVWLSYALGGGRASKGAASAMSRQQANWANNFFDGWEGAGGNGAAMRIQPHVYSAVDLGSFAHLDDVVRNAVVTHGHPRGLVGAVFHAVSLTVAFLKGQVPTPSDFGMILEVTRDALSAFSRQPELAAYWVPQWERKAELGFASTWHETVDEVAELLEASRSAWPALQAAGADRQRAADAYEELVRLFGLDDETRRGSATLTSVTALLLAAAFPDHPAQSAQIAAGRLNTDTDTIGTMAAAIVGAGSPRELVSPVLDSSYIEAEAERLTLISLHRQTPSFSYPDLLEWRPPKSASDAVGFANGRLALAGLGYIEPIGESTANRDAVWTWTRTEFGQSMLVKQRLSPRDLDRTNYPSSSVYLEDWMHGRRVRPMVPQPSKPQKAPEPPAPKRVPDAAAGTVQPRLFEDTDQTATVEALLSEVTRGGFRDEDIGRALRALSQVSLSDAELFAIEVARRIRERDAT